MKKIWVHKSDSFKKAGDFNSRYYAKMSASKRLETVQYLRESSPEFGKVKNGNNRKRLRRVLKLLHKHKVRYCIVGAYALAFQLGYEPVRIDLLTSIDGCSFKQIWKNRKRGKYGKANAFFIGRSDLIKNKKASNRIQDKADLESLLK